MEKNKAEKYQLRYMLLVKEFIGEVEKGKSWPQLKPLVQEMRYDRPTPENSSN